MSGVCNLFEPCKLTRWAPLLVFLLAIHVNFQELLQDKTNPGDVSRFGLGKPDELASYDQFRANYPQEDKHCTSLEDSNRRLWFAADLVEIARNNLATLAGKQLYFMRQSIYRSHLSPREQQQLWHNMDLLLSLSSSSSSSYGSSRPVSGAGKGEHSRAKLEKLDPVSKWFSRLVNKESHFEIPNFPLDQQPNPDKITHIDSDLRFCAGEVRDQKDCGACYAFSFNSLAEWHYCRQSGDTSVDFSEQFVLDCGAKAKLRGCVEGLLPDAKDFAHFMGMFPEKDYPYTGKKGKCRAESGPINVDVRDWTRLRVDRHQWEQVLKEQPILVEVMMPRDIMSYSRGVHPGHNCDERIGHGMILMGYGRQDGVAYWLLKSSSGSKWGERGYLRLSREAPMKECFANGFVSKFKFKDLDEDKFDDFYQSIEFTRSVEPEKRSKSDQPNPIAQFLKSK